MGTKLPGWKSLPDRRWIPGRYDLARNSNWGPNALFWTCLVVGAFMFGSLWIIPVLYQFIEPSSAYQQALTSIPSYLPLQPQPQYYPHTGQPLPGPS